MFPTATSGGGGAGLFREEELAVGWCPLGAGGGPSEDAVRAGPDGSLLALAVGVGSGVLAMFLRARRRIVARCRSSSVASVIAVRSAWTSDCSSRTSRLRSSTSGSAPQPALGSERSRAVNPAINALVGIGLLTGFLHWFFVH